MAILTVVKPSLTGADPAFVAAAGGGDSFPNTGKETVHVKNGGGSEITPTFDAPGTCDFGVAANAAHDASGPVPAGGTRVYGPFAPAKFNDGNGRVQISYSGVTTVTVAVLA